MALAKTESCSDIVLEYQKGFGNEFASEALAGALPVGQNSPQKSPLGLFSELVSGTAFSAPRSLNRRSYLFRIRPSVSQGVFGPLDNRNFLTPPLDIEPYPGPLRWAPFAMPEAPTDFIQGILTICGNGSPKDHVGMAVHSFAANRSMDARAFSNADAECLILPQIGGLRLVTEIGILHVRPGEVALVPKGMKFRVDLLDGPIRGFLCENYGHPFVLPDLGLIGSHGLANAIDFEVPVAAYEDKEGPVELVHKLAGSLWSAELDHSPFDVVAWRGNWTPSKFDMRRFMVMGALNFDHPDPSIFCALSSPSSSVSGGNLDFMVLPPRWMVAEHTFRPPGFHRNCVAEFLSVIQGSHEARSSSFPPGSVSVHNSWTPHGPDFATYEAAREADLAPVKIEDALVFMFETRFPLEVASQALEGKNRQREGHRGWEGFRKRFPEG
ncbi:homogentisate 1,2-dioxygenase [Sphingomonas sp. SRS2]|uniref:homogentisate 1,2-dioxygenase n=1 Tax=Sphingomonas sp. SRS2 TaxID=133190 RepID=UPI0006985DE5|nr:homogentisate 1,2-dioxygenase [Sphingomonas sp. SRS2]